MISQRTENYVLQHKKREEEVKIKTEKGGERKKEKNPMRINQIKNPQSKKGNECV